MALINIVNYRMHLVLLAKNKKNQTDLWNKIRFAAYAGCCLFYSIVTPQCVVEVENKGSNMYIF